MQGCSDGEAADALCLTALAADLSCPVCMSLVADPFVTPCGHTFCFACVSKALETSRNCPSCSAALAADAIYPNFALSKVSSSGSGACSSRCGFHPSATKWLP